MDTADMFPITFLQNDAKDNFVIARNGLAFPEFGPFSILKNTHVVLKLWRIFGLNDSVTFWVRPRHLTFV